MNPRVNKTHPPSSEVRREFFISEIQNTGSNEGWGELE